MWCLDGERKGGGRRKRKIHRRPEQVQRVNQDAAESNPLRSFCLDLRASGLFFALTMDDGRGGRRSGRFCLHPPDGEEAAIMKMILMCGVGIKNHSSQGIFTRIVSPNRSLISCENGALAPAFRSLGPRFRPASAGQVISFSPILRTAGSHTVPAGQWELGEGGAPWRAQVREEGERQQRFLGRRASHGGCCRPVPVVACLSTRPCQPWACAVCWAPGLTCEMSVSFQAVSSCKSPPLRGQKLGTYGELLFSLSEWNTNLWVCVGSLGLRLMRTLLAHITCLPSPP